MSRIRTTAIATATILALLSGAPAAGQQPAPDERGAVEVRVIEHDEFRWVDAGIGALVGAGLAAICAGLFIAGDRRKRPTP